MGSDELTEQRIDQPVKLTDNGVRSFIPPTFCFELHDETGNVIATVSQIIWTEQGASDFEVVGRLESSCLRATGIVSEYEAGPQARQPGRRFAIHGVVSNGH
jgi:hypothetical protein